jgi:prepilin-type N-terminal cleavage/methylation domain-containing protein
MKHITLKTPILAFTLVELIVVIVILGILSTIGFVSYNGYLGGARDSNRISQLKNITDALNLYQSKNTLPLPETYTTIIASGALIGYQGTAGASILEIVNYTSGGKDPKDDSYYTYYLSSDRKNFQLLTLLEEADNLETRNTHTNPNIHTSLFTQSYAADYTNRFPKVYGKKLWVLTQTISNIPIQELNLVNTTLDIATTSDTYNAYFTDSDKLTGTGIVLRNSLWNANCKRLSQTGNFTGNKYYSIFKNGQKLQVYCHQNFLDTTFYTFFENGNFESSASGSWAEPYMSPAANYQGLYGLQFKGYTYIVPSDLYTYIEPWKTYELGWYFRSQWSTQSILYFGFMEFDENFVPILNHHVNAIPGTDTTLVQAVNATDTSIVIQDVGGTTCAKWSSHPYFSTLWLITFDTDDSGKYNDLPNRTQSQLLYISPKVYSAFTSMVDNGSTCILTSSTSIGVSRPAWTKIRMHIPWWSYNYIAAEGSFVPNTWTYYSWKVYGEQIFWANSNYFRRGTRFIKLFVIPNYGQWSAPILQWDNFFVEIK